MSKRGAIKPKSDITEIVKRTAQKTGLKPADVQREINMYWVDVDLVFTHYCGYLLNIDQFCTFHLYAPSVYFSARVIDKMIRKKMKLIDSLIFLKKEMKADSIRPAVAELMTRLIFLNYTVELYQKNVYEAHRGKYKITYLDNYKAIVTGLEKLFGVSISEFPITINHPIQAMFVRYLRREGLLHNPVVSNIHMYRGNYKGRKNKNQTAEGEEV